MSYLALARKWRPKKFSDVVGQTYTVQALSHALEQQKPHHAYLFTGTRGVGKTTLARIMAKCLNCETGITATPCGDCNSCKAVDAGNHMDLLEVDAASKTKVEDTREILENVQYRPTQGRFKVYLIDEVHMLSKHSFNALLKTLEEPPAHVVFLLATTDHQKLPATVLSRCLQFHLLSITEKDIAQQISHILTKENIEHDAHATELLAKAANGSLRDALSLLDQAIAYDNGKVTTSAMKQLLGFVDPKHTHELITALANNDINAALETSKQLAQQGTNFSQALDALLSTLHDMAIAQATGQSTQDFPSLSAENIQLYYQIALTGKKDITLAPSQQAGFEMLIVRMFCFTPNKKTPVLQQPAKNQPMAEKPSSTSSNTPQPVQAKNSSVEKTTLDNAIWNDTFLKALNLTGVAWALARHSALEKIENDTVFLLLEPNQKPLMQNGPIERISQALTAYFNKTIKLNIRVNETTNSLALQQEQREKNLQDSAKQQIKQDVNVQKIINSFDATVIEDSITSH